MAATIRGVNGQITWSYYVAAHLKGFTVTRDDRNRWTARGAVESSDPFKLMQRPLRFVMPTQKGEWRWPVEDLQIIDGRFTAVLGAPLPEALGAIVGPSPNGSG